MKPFKFILVLLFFAISNVVFSQAPVAGIALQSGFSRNGCSAHTIGFKSTSTGTISSYNWTISPGSIASSTLANPVFTIVDPGSYTMTLTVTNSSGSNSTTYGFTVYQNPTADFTTTPLTGCAPLKADFTNNSTAGSSAALTYNWNFGDGNNNTTLNPSNTYNNAGAYSVSLEVTDGNSCKNSIIKSNLITVSTSPTATITSTPASLVSCSSPFDVSVTGNATGGMSPYKYEWDWGYAGTSDINYNKTADTSYTGLGSHDIVLKVTDKNGCSDTAIREVNIVNFIAGVNADDTIICKGGSINFSNASTGGTYGATSWLWNFGNGNTSISKNPGDQTYNTEGTYTVTLNVSNANGCTDETSIDILVNPSPTIAFSADKEGSCELPFSPLFTATSNPAGATYSWCFESDFPTPNAACYSTTDKDTARYTYNAEGDFNVALKITDINGCTSLIVKEDYITILKPKVNFVADTIDGCVNFTSHFSTPSTSPGYTGSAGTDLTYSWSIEMPDTNTNPSTTVAFQSTNATPEVLYADSGEFDVHLTITNALGCKASITKENYITPGILPYADFVADVVYGCHPLKVKFDTVNAATYIEQWTWDFGDDQTASNATPTHVYNFYPKDTGKFTVELVINFNNCRDTITKDSLIHVLAPSPMFFIYDSAYTTINDSIRCLGESRMVVFNDSSLTDPANTTYTWDFGDGNVRIVPLQDTVMHYYPKVGIYSIKLELHNATTGCTDSIKKRVYIDHFTVDFVAPESECIKIPVNFSSSYIDSLNILYDTINKPFAPVQWAWSYGDGGSTFLGGSTFTTSHTYNSSGSPNVTLLGTNLLLCNAFIIKPLQAKPLPVAEFISDSLSFASDKLFACGPASFQYIDQSTSSNGVITKWRWTFDGLDTLTNDTTLNKFYNFQPDVFKKTYTIALQVTDTEGCVSNVKTKTLTVTKPVAKFAISDTDSIICAGSRLILNSSSSLGESVTYSWDLDTAGSSIAFSTEIRDTIEKHVDTTTVLNVALYIKDTYGCLDTAYMPITLSKPVADFYTPTTTSDCPPLNNTYLFTGSSDVTAWNYNLGNGASTSDTSNPSGAYTAPGTFTVQLIATNQYACKDTLIKTDYINVSGPKATFSYSPLSGCPPVEVTITTANTTNVSEYRFVFGDGADSTVTLPDNQLSTPVSIKHIYQNAGTYYPSVIIKDTLNKVLHDSEYCVFTLVNPDIPIKLSGPIIDFNADKENMCDPEPVTFTNLTNLNGSTLSTPTSWLWEFGDGTTSNEETPPAHNYSDLGYFNVSLTAYAVPSCTSKVTKNKMLSVFKGPDLNFEATGKGCPPLTLQFNSDTSVLASGNIHATQINWTFGDGNTSTISNPSNTYQLSGTYTPQLNVVFDNGCDYTYQSQGSVLVYEKPKPMFEYEPVVKEGVIAQYQFTSTGETDVKWKWNFGDTVTDTIKNPLHSFEADNVYEVMLITENEWACIDTVLQKITFKSIIELPNIFTPNGDGVNDVFKINLHNFEPCATIKVYDRWGTLRFSKENYNNDWDGKDNNGNRLAVDTYYYEIIYCDKLSWNGWVMINYND